MSILFSSQFGWLISHYNYLSNVYSDPESEYEIKFRNDLFAINIPYTHKRTREGRHRRTTNIPDNEDIEQRCRDISNVKSSFASMLIECKSNFDIETAKSDNFEALNLSNEIYKSTENVLQNASGANKGKIRIETIDGSRYIFPENCRFYCHDISQLKKYCQSEKFDLILLDPPWWNKYIRRKRKKSYSYNMMFNEDLKDINLNEMLTEDGLVVVWCTNSSQNLSCLINDIFPSWGIKFTSRWYWLKTTRKGDVVCNFSNPPGKQPFEQIIFGSRNNRALESPPDGKLVISIPSALHSHKPPLTEVLKMYLPSNPKCLELFARYLLPNWTSYGNEVLKFQHESLFEVRLRKCEDKK